MHFYLHLNFRLENSSQNVDVIDELMAWNFSNEEYNRSSDVDNDIVSRY